MGEQRYKKVMDGAAAWASFYRNNPDRFAEDYLHLKLKLFQRVLLIMMFLNTVFVWVASRGAGKSFLSAIYCVIRCILYPGQILKAHLYSNVHLNLIELLGSPKAMSATA